MGLRYDPPVGTKHRDIIADVFEKLTDAYEMPQEIPPNIQAAVDRMMAEHRAELSQPTVGLIGTMVCAILYDSALEGANWGPLRAVTLIEAICRALEA